MRIIYPLGGGGIAVISPTDCGLSIKNIARKDVPAGIPYRIVSTSDIPADRTWRDAWTADFAEPDGYGIGPEAWFAAGQAGAQTEEISS